MPAIINKQSAMREKQSAEQVNMGVFPSGQRGQTVNLLRFASVVRIHPLPPKRTDTNVSVLFLSKTSKVPRLSCRGIEPIALVLNIKQMVALKTKRAEKLLDKRRWRLRAAGNQYRRSHYTPLPGWFCEKVNWLYEKAHLRERCRPRNNAGPGKED